MFGYASDETPELMPLADHPGAPPLQAAVRGAQERPDPVLAAPDGKTQVHHRVRR
ncbi:hypothetical protein [Kitasatospora albolonga]|uniref:hypothetical protein n=1 Tax=Kitasatospora albolonga TaxID=68173 RepID=UPI003CD0842E